MVHGDGQVVPFLLWNGAVADAGGDVGESLAPGFGAEAGDHRGVAGVLAVEDAGLMVLLRGVRAGHGSGGGGRKGGGGGVLHRRRRCPAYKPGVGWRVAAWWGQQSSGVACAVVVFDVFGAVAEVGVAVFV